MNWRAILTWSVALPLCPALLVRAEPVGGRPARPPNPPRPEPARLSRTEAVQEALTYNPALEAAREQVAESKAGITVARAWPDPSIVTESDQLTSFLNQGSASERDIGLQFTVPYPGRTRLNGRVARAAWQEARYTLAQLQQQTAAQTAQAYDTLLVALRHQDDLTQSEAMSRQFLERTEARFRGGTVPKLDVLKARVDDSKSKLDLITNEHAIAMARAALNRLLGRPIGGAIEPSDPLVFPAPLPDLDALKELARRRRPELQAMALQQQAARDSTALAKQYWIPDVNLTMWRSYIPGAPDSYKLDAGVSLPLFFWNHERGAIAQAKHKERELQATGTDLQAQVMLDVENAYSTAVTAWQQAEYLRDQLLPEARAAYQAASTSYAIGGSSALELMDAKGVLLSAESQYTDALGAVNTAREDLERAIGAPLPSFPSGTHEK